MFLTLQRSGVKLQLPGGLFKNTFAGLHPQTLWFYLFLVELGHRNFLKAPRVIVICNQTENSCFNVARYLKYMVIL